MAQATPELIEALRISAERLSGQADYQWGHMGMCNCGHLARSITGLTEWEIHESAQVREGDWERQARNYCPTSGLLIDHVIAAMLMIGMTRQDIGHLEKLSDPEVCCRIPRTVMRNRREDVVLYMRTWADHLESLERPCHSERERGIWVAALWKPHAQIPRCGF